MFSPGGWNLPCTFKVGPVGGDGSQAADQVMTEGAKLRQRQVRRHLDLILAVETRGDVRTVVQIHIAVAKLSCLLQLRETQTVTLLLQQLVWASEWCHTGTLPWWSGSAGLWGRLPGCRVHSICQTKLPATPCTAGCPPTCDSHTRPAGGDTDDKNNYYQQNIFVDLFNNVFNRPLLSDWNLEVPSNILIKKPLTLFKDSENLNSQNNSHPKPHFKTP